MAVIKLNITNTTTTDMYLPIPNETDLMPWQIIIFKVTGNERSLIPTKQTAGCLQTQEVKGKRFYHTVHLTSGKSCEIVLKLDTILVNPLERGDYSVTIRNYGKEYNLNFTY